MTDATSIEAMIRSTGIDVDADRWRLLGEHAELKADRDGTRVRVTYEFGLGPHAHRWLDQSNIADETRSEVCTRCGEERTVTRDTPRLPSGEDDSHGV